MSIVHDFFHRLHRFPNPRRSAVILIVLLALMWTSTVFCGDIFDAVQDGDLAKVQTLLKEYPALVSTFNQSNETPLHCAAQYGHKDVAEFLIANKAEIDSKAWYSQMPLHDTAVEGHKDVVELLLANKADVKAKDNDGQTPL
jgi:ankyrin repeat protein